MSSSKIHTRGLTSFFTLFGFIIMSITGLVLYVVPVGRVAYWITWSLFGMTKTDWGNIHILSSILFIVAGIFHTILNWKPLMNYFKTKASQGINLKKELLISSVISIWIVISAIFPFPPLSYLLDFNEYVKTTWIATDDYEPPFGHAELLSLKTFMTRMDMDFDAAIQELKANEIKFSSTDETLEEIAINNNTTPMEIYLLIKKFEPVPVPIEEATYTPESIEVEFSGGGIGNKNIRMMSERTGMTSEVALFRLAGNGVKATEESTLKDLATEYNSKPIEILKAMILEDYLITEQ